MISCFSSSNFFNCFFSLSSLAIAWASRISAFFFARVFKTSMGSRRYLRSDFFTRPSREDSLQLGDRFVEMDLVLNALLEEGVHLFDLLDGIVDAGVAARLVGADQNEVAFLFV